MRGISAFARCRARSPPSQARLYARHASASGNSGLVADQAAGGGEPPGHTPLATHGVFEGFRRRSVSRAMK